MKPIVALSPYVPLGAVAGFLGLVYFLGYYHDDAATAGMAFNNLLLALVSVFAAVSICWVALGGVFLRVALAVAGSITIVAAVLGPLSFLIYDRVTRSPIHFQERVLIANLSYAYGFAIADFTGDDLLDVSVSDSQRHGLDGGISAGLWLISNQDASMIVSGETFDFAPPRPKVLFEEHVAVDLDRDGRLDIMGVANSHGAVVGYLNRGKRHWPRVVLSISTPGAVNLAAGDINGDGRVDAVVGLRSQTIDPIPGRGLVWLENTGLSGPWKKHEIDTSNRWHNTRTVQIGDINLDGKQDVLATDYTTGHAVWFENTGSGWLHHTIPVNAKHGIYGRLFDVNGDGRLDAVLPHRHGISIFLNRPNVTWEEVSVAHFPAWGPWSYQKISDVEPGDIDGDGLIDIVFTVNAGDRLEGSVLWARNTGKGWSLHPIKSPWGGRVARVRLADLNGDGRLDIIALAENGAQEVRWWKALD